MKKKLNRPTKMTDAQILAMISDILIEVDYDTYDGLIANPEEPETADEIVNNLYRIVREHIE